MVVSRNRGMGTRLGMSVSKRAGNSVTRNRIKRLIREYFRLNRNGLESDADFLFIVRAPLESLDAHDIWRKLEELTARYKVDQERDRE